MEAKFEVTILKAKEGLGPKKPEETNKDYPLESSEKMWPCCTLDMDFWVPAL
jgi:hypothetical protein